MLFNKDTFFSDVKVKSIDLHDTRRELPDKVIDGDSGWVLQGVLSRASLRRQPLSGQKTFTVLSLNINNVYAEKRGMGKKLTIRAVMLDENVDLVAGDFNGAAWRCDNRNNNQYHRRSLCRPRLADASWLHSLNRLNPIVNGNTAS